MKKRYEGYERLHIGKDELPYDMLKFWQLSLSDILFNMNRGTFAEYIVRCALMEGGFNAFEYEDNGTIDPYDVTGPYIPSLNRQSRIEVKSTASIQSGSEDKSEPFSLPDTKLIFGIRPAIDWSASTAGARRNNDLYVFCHYKATRKSDDILDLDLWDFYVYPTFMIEENPILSKQKTISIYRLKKLGVMPQPFVNLYAEISRCIAIISEHEKAGE